MDRFQLKICDIQGRLFENSYNEGYDSINFISSFMNSPVAVCLDSKYNRMQWAGEEYLMEELQSEFSFPVNNELYPKDILFWIGYVYRYWHFYTGDASKDIYQYAPAQTMCRNYLMFHTMDPAMAIDDLMEIYKQKGHM